MARLVTVAGSMYVVDDEDFVADETGRLQFNESTEIDDDQPEDLLHFEKRVGDEVRVELDIRPRLMRDDRIRFHVTAVLFEGSSSDTTDEDGRQEMSFVVRPGRTRRQSFRILNEDEGGDYADISFTCSNVRA
jgi:hypothetical protein